MRRSHGGRLFPHGMDRKAYTCGPPCEKRLSRESKTEPSTRPHSILWRRSRFSELATVDRIAFLIGLHQPQHRSLHRLLPRLWKIHKMDERKSFVQRIRNSFSILGHLFYKASKDDFEKKLQHLSIEEASAHTRLKRRSQTWRKLARAIIVYSIIIELLILGIAIIATRAPELSWQMRAVRVLPVFVFPALASLLYSTSASYYRMRERKDQKTLDRLRNERQAKIDELKERTNYYLTQQLIQKYDSDPAAKEAAARVLAAKIGAEAGLKLSLEPSHVDKTQLASTDAKSQDVNLHDSTGLRKRRTHQETPSISQMPLLQDPVISETTATTGRTGQWEQGMELAQYSGKTGGGGGGWVARLAAMLVGEDPTQCYALICKTCHMHNGLARKEDFQYISYYCPHCHTLNGSTQLGESRDSSNVLETSPADVGFQQLENDILLSSAAKGMVIEAVSPGSSTTVSDRVDYEKND